MADIVLKITPTTITDLIVKMPDGGAYVTYTLADVVDMTDWLELEMPCDTDGKVFIESTGYVSQTVTFQSANNPYTIDLVEATDDAANLSDGVDSYSVKDKQARFEIDMLKNTKQEKLLEGLGISIGTNYLGQQEIATNPDQTYNPTSTNAQSGVAVAQAVADTITTSDLATCHVVVETGTSGNNWYRKWSDGWLEQGGIADYGSDARSTNATITFPKAFSNTNYTIQYLAQRSGTSGNCNGASGCRNKSKTGIYLTWYGNGANDYMRYFNWYAVGF